MQRAWVTENVLIFVNEHNGRIYLDEGGRIRRVLVFVRNGKM